MLLVLLVLLTVTLAPHPLAAQDFGFRLGGGPIVAGATGLAGMLALEVAQDLLFVRAESRVIGAGPSVRWDRSARVVAAGGALGIRKRPTGGATPYAMLLLGGGLDWREADHLTALGAAVGVDDILGGPFFAEARYEHWSQRGPRHVEIPTHAVGVAVGLKLD